MEVQAFDAGEVFAFQQFGANAEAAAGGAGIVEGDFDFGVLGVHANAGARCVAGGGFGSIKHRLEFPKLGEGIEAQMMRDGDDLTHLLLFKSGRIDMHLPAEFLGEQRFIQATGAAAAQILAHDREHAEHGEAFEREQDACAGFTLHVGEFFHVLPQQRDVHHVGGGVDGVDVEGRKRLLVNVGRGEGGGGHSGKELGR